MTTKPQVEYDDLLNDLGWRMNDFLTSRGCPPNGQVFNDTKTFLRITIQTWVEANWPDSVPVGVGPVTLQSADMDDSSLEKFFIKEGCIYIHFKDTDQYVTNNLAECVYFLNAFVRDMADQKSEELRIHHEKCVWMDRAIALGYKFEPSVEKEQK